MEPTKQVPATKTALSRFDPEGPNFDYTSAKAAGMMPRISPVDNKPHWGSVRETTVEEQKQYGLPSDSFLMLKGRQHPTWHKAIAGEKRRGYRVERIGGRYWSVPEGTHE
jgi:hypothetical protein